MSETALDIAARAQQSDPRDEAARLRFYERILDAELFLLLASEAEDRTLRPRLFDLEAGRFVLCFDRSERMAAFLDEPAPYAALPGRRLMALLDGQALGLGLNLDVAPSATLLPADAVAWLAGLGRAAPVPAEGLPRRFTAPREAPADLVAALGVKLRALAHVATGAYLVTAEYRGGGSGLLLVLVGFPEAAQPHAAAAIGETAGLHGGPASTLDVAFLTAVDPALPALRRAGFAFEMPRPAPPVRRDGRAPGTDPGKPPILK